MSRVIVVEPGGGESISGGNSARHVKVDIEAPRHRVHRGGRPHGRSPHPRASRGRLLRARGELEVAISETETLRLGPGGLAVAPPGAVHSFGVPERARFLNIHAPGMSFAAYLREIVALRERGEEPTRELFERFDMHPGVTAGLYPRRT